MSYQNITLGEVAEVFNGKTPSKTEQRTEGHPVLKIRDVDAFGRFSGSFDSFVESELIEKYPTKRVVVGDVLLLNAAHNADYVGTKIYSAQPEVVGSLATGEWLMIRANPKRLDHRYLYYWTTCEHYKRMIKDMVKGIHLYPKDVKLSPIPLPALAEQKRIAAILDQADALRAKRRAALARLEALVQSVFLEMFGDPVTNPMGWEEMELHQTAIHFSDGPFGSNLKTEHYTPSGVRVIRLQNIGIGYLDDSDQAFISEEHYQSLPRHHCKPDDVIIGTMGDPNLRALIVPNSLKRCLNKADCIQYRVNRELIIPEYACWLLNNPRTIQKAEQLSLGQTRLRISMGRLKGLSIPVPPLERQFRFSNSLTVISQMISKYETSVSQSDKLFHSLQQRAFRGEL